MMIKEKKAMIIEVDNYDFEIQYVRESEGWIAGSVLQIQKWEIPSTGEKGWSYQHNEHSLETDNPEEARNWFDWSICWRGVWEGRINFKDEEYWGEEMPIITSAWRIIEHEMKKILKEYAGK